MKIPITISFLFIVFLLNAQQSNTVAFGDMVHDEKKHKSFLPICISDPKESKYTFVISNPHLNRLDYRTFTIHIYDSKTLKKLKSKTIEFKKTSDKKGKSFLSCIQSGNRLFFLSKDRDNFSSLEKKTTIYLEEFDVKTLKLEKTKQLTQFKHSTSLITLGVSKRFISYKVMKEYGQLLVGLNILKGVTGYAEFIVLLFDKDMNLVRKKKTKLPAKSLHFAKSEIDFTSDKEGNLYLLTLFTEKNRDLSFKYFDQMEAVIYKWGIVDKRRKKTPLKPKGKFPVSAKINHRDGMLHCAGFYSEAGYYSEGIFTAKFSDSLSNIHLKIFPYEDKLLSNSDLRKRDKGKKIKGKSNFYINDFIFDKENNIYLFGETQFISTNPTSPQNNRSTFNLGNLDVFKISKDGELLWSGSISKSLSSNSPSTAIELGSYLPILKNNKLYIIYNIAAYDLYKTTLKLGFTISLPKPKLPPNTRKGVNITAFDQNGHKVTRPFLQGYLFRYDNCIDARTNLIVSRKKFTETLVRLKI